MSTPAGPTPPDHEPLDHEPPAHEPHDTAPEATMTDQTRTDAPVLLTKADRPAGASATAPPTEPVTAPGTGRTSEPTTQHVTQPVPEPAVVLVEPQGPALGTLVWGCTALAVAALLGAWEVADVRVDLGLTVPVAMVALGLLLVVGAVVTAVRQRR